jgi:hypothetical protein
VIRIIQIRSLSFRGARKSERTRNLEIVARDSGLALTRAPE